MLRHCVPTTCNMINCHDKRINYPPPQHTPSHLVVYYVMAKCLFFPTVSRTIRHILLSWLAYMFPDSRPHSSVMMTQALYTTVFVSMATHEWRDGKVLSLLFQSSGRFPCPGRGDGRSKVSEENCELTVINGVDWQWVCILSQSLQATDK